MLKKVLTGAVSIIVLSSTPAQAQQMDANSRDLLIKKLEKINADMAPEDETKKSIILRLADLYAEKGRQAAMSDLANDCTNCVAGSKERQVALKYYGQVLESLAPDTKGKVLVQMGHLHELLYNEAQAISFYERILKESITTPEAKGEANLSLAEIYFKRRDFAKAKTYYQKVLESPRGNKGLAAYRKAWSSFNMGQAELAVKEIIVVLESPELLSRTTAVNANVDTSFHEEASRDYATFLSKVNFSKADAEKLFKLSPATTQVANVMVLALEAERLGRKNEAYETWSFIYPHLKNPEDKMNAQVSMAQMQFDLGNKNESLANFKTGMQIAQELKACESSQCVELKRRTRHLVVNWNQTEKRTPSAELLTAYEIYLSVFPDDVDMNVYAAEIARGHEKYDVSNKYYIQAQTYLAQQPKEAKKLESVLLHNIEVAELAKNEAMIMKSYKDYLALSPTKAKAFEVRYQMARDQYEKANYKEASANLRILALDKKGDSKIRKQAADLSLDALVLLKDELTVGVWAAEYAKAFPAEAGGTEFAQMAQKSALNTSAALAEKDPQGAYTALGAFKPDQASADDRIKYYKNKLILAEKLKLYPEAQTAASDLLKQPALSVEDQEFAWARKAYMAELTLDFETAIAALENLKTTLPADEKALKIALFAELSGKASVPYYTQYLKVAKDEEAKTQVATELVRKAEDREKAIEAYSAYLKSNPNLVATLYLEAYARTPKDSILKKVTGDSKLKATEPGKLLTRVVFLKEFDAAKAKLVEHKLDTSNDRKLVASIKTRGTLLNKVEDQTKKAIANQDWTSQLVSLDLLAKESERFYQELISAPIPAGLSPEEEGEYLNLLSAQAAPFQEKATQAKAKVEEFWAQSNWSDAFKKAWAKEEFRSLLSVEIEALKAIAPEGQQAQLASITAETPAAESVAAAAKPTAKEIQAARAKVNKDPMNRSALEELLQVEKKAENKPMVQYLQTRIETLDKNKAVN